MLQTARLPPCHCQCLLSSSHWHVFLDTGTALAQQMACSVCPQLGFQGCVKALYKEVLFALRLQLNVPQHVKGIYQLHYTMHQNLKQGSEIFLTDLSNFGQGAKTLLWKPSFHLELFQCLTFRVLLLSETCAQICHHFPPPCTSTGCRGLQKPILMWVQNQKKLLQRLSTEAYEM